MTVRASKAPQADYPWMWWLSDKLSRKNKRQAKLDHLRLRKWRRAQDKAFCQAGRLGD
jgi:hypothetical protein